MKSRPLILITMTLFAALAIAPGLAAQDQQEQAAQPQRYTVTALSTLGGTAGVGNGINNKGWVAGAANLTGDKTEHATLWRNGVITDLGTLGGPNSFVNNPVKDDRGLIVGFAETSTPDPLGEGFCAAVTFGGFFTTGLTCLGFLWQDGVIAPLPTLGGNNAQANGVNNRGQVVGYAENSTRDPTCIAPQVLQFEAVMWGPKRGEVQELPPLPDDLDGAAIAINDKGQVAGCSGICGNASGFGCVHAVVWQNGSPIRIGDLGGTVNLAGGINERGQVVGGSLLPDNTVHSFLWQNGVITDLGTLPGDVLVFAGGFNNKGQVVGHTCDATDTFCRAFLWQNGVMTDLNTLTPPGSSLFLAYAGDINDRGEIVGVAVDQITGETPAFLAIPCDEEHSYAEGCNDDQGGTSASRSQSSERPKVVLPENVRKLRQQRMRFGRF